MCRHESDSSVSCVAQHVLLVSQTSKYRQRRVLVSAWVFAIVLHVTRSGLDHLRSAVRLHVEREGLRPLSVRTGIPVGQLRSLMQGRAALSTTLERVSSALGLEFYVGPPREPASARARRGYEGQSVRERPASGDEAAPAWAIEAATRIARRPSRGSGSGAGRAHGRQARTPASETAGDRLTWWWRLRAARTSRGGSEPTPWRGPIRDRRAPELNAARAMG